MLSSDYIHEKILDTASCSNEDVRKLAELMELYPYVSSFPILYLKALANSKDVRLESEIEKYAYRITSRTVLFELLHPRFEVEIAPQTAIQEEVENPISETIEVEEKIVPEVQEEIVQEVENPVSETNVVEEEITPEVQVEIVEETENLVSETVEIEEEITPEAQAEIVKEVENLVSEKIEVTALETIVEIKEEIAHPTEKPNSEKIEIEVSDEFKKENDQLEQLIQSSALSSNYIISNFSEEEDKHEQEVVEIEIQTEKIIEEIPVIEIFGKEQVNTRSFSSWLSFGATKEPEKATLTIEEKTPEIEPEFKKTEYYNFDKPKKEFYSPVKKAKESLNENNMPVSETLAKIFALQGNYPKSIYVYEQLILIFPEKKSFFATQIKNLKKKLNS